MAKIIDFQAYRMRHENSVSGVCQTDPQIGVEYIDDLAEKVEAILDNAAQNDRFAHTVALTAGRYAAMQLFQLHGRAQTLSFFEDCIQTVELCDDLLKQIDEDF